MGRHIAFVLILAVTALIALGLVMLFSVSAYAPDNNGNPLFFLTRQLVWLVIAVVLARTDYQVWIRYLGPILGISAVLMILCFLPGIGRGEIKGAHRWIGFGPFSAQPMELAKLAAILWVAAWLGKNVRRIDTFRNGFAIPLAVTMGMAGLTVAQKDLGTTFLLFLITVILMFSAGTKLIYLIPLPPLGVAGIISMALLSPQKFGRLMAFMDPEAHKMDGGWQPWQALIAFGSGGPEGLGLGNSVQKMQYLPEAHTDFIFPILGEELGLPFTLLVVFCFLMIALAGGYISFHAPEPTGVLIGLGATSLVCLQAGMNMAVTTSLMPTKGIGLPFISYGGSNLLMCMICVGVLLNIHRQAIYEIPKAARILPTAATIRM
jgi:cell division protein FtsW